RGGEEARDADGRAARLRRRRDRATWARGPADRRAMRLHPVNPGSAGVDLPRDDGGVAPMADVAGPVELYGASGCPYTTELRERLRWNGVEFTEYDVEADGAARERLVALVGPHPGVPVLVEGGRVTGIGWRGRSCAVGGP